MNCFDTIIIIYGILCVYPPINFSIASFVILNSENVCQNLYINIYLYLSSSLNVIFSLLIFTFFLLKRLNKKYKEKNLLLVKILLLCHLILKNLFVIYIAIIFAKKTEFSCYDLGVETLCQIGLILECINIMFYVICLVSIWKQK